MKKYVYKKSSNIGPTQMAMHREDYIISFSNYWPREFDKLVRAFHFSIN